MGKVLGDICELGLQKDKQKSGLVNEELKKELGNVIFSTIRWCDDLGYDPEECIDKAIKCQKEFKK
jgi:NTP pyrophosphatase (non-canonical NTP hydrolase)